MNVCHSDLSNPTQLNTSRVLSKFSVVTLFLIGMNKGARTEKSFDIFNQTEGEDVDVVVVVGSDLRVDLLINCTVRIIVCGKGLTERIQRFLLQRMG